MKILKVRTSFVTNSSSSSFIIAYKSLPEIDEDTIKKYPFLKKYSDMIEKLLLTETECSSKGEVFKTKDEVDKFLLWNYGYDTIEELKEDIVYGEDFYNDIIKYINNGFNILFKEVDHNDEFFEHMVKQVSENNDDFAIILNDK